MKNLTTCLATIIYLFIVSCSKDNTHASVQFVNRFTSEPIANARIDLFKINIEHGDRTQITTYTTDQNGLVEIPNTKIYDNKYYETGAGLETQADGVNYNYLWQLIIVHKKDRGLVCKVTPAGIINFKANPGNWLNVTYDSLEVHCLNESIVVVHSNGYEECRFTNNIPNKNATVDFYSIENGIKNLIVSQSYLSKHSFYDCEDYPCYYSFPF